MNDYISYDSHSNPNWHPIIKSMLTIGNITFYFEKKFNWFNRLMLRLVFGLKIENVKDSD